MTDTGTSTTTTAIETTAGRPRRHIVVMMCFLAMFVCYIDRVNISVAIIAMQGEFGWSETIKGLIMSSFFFGYMLTMVIGGILANRFGGKIVMGIAVIWWSAFTFLTPWAAYASLPLLIAARILLGVGEAASTPAAMNLYSRWVPANERSRAVALLSSGAPVGIVVALFLSGWMVTEFGWPTVFYAFAVIGFLWAVPWFFLIHNDPADDPKLSNEERALLPKEHGSAGGTKSPVPWKALLSHRAIWALLATSFCSNWSLYMFMAWLPSYFSATQNLSITSSGLYAAAPWAVFIVMLNVAGWITDTMIKRGMSITAARKLVQTIGLVGPAVMLLMVNQMQSAGGALALLCCALGLMAFCWSGFAVNSLEIAPRHADILWSITNTVGTIPGIFAVAITGWLVDTTGTYASAFMLAAGVSVVGAAVWLAFSTSQRLID